MPYTMSMVKQNLLFCTVLLLRIVIGEVPKFRILAPEFICPKDENTAIDKPDDTIITLQTAAGADFDIAWAVRWKPLVAPSQFVTLKLWRAVRALETKLNGPQSEPYVYVIANDELLHGVEYIFNVTSVETNGDVGAPKTFHIDNTQGDQILDNIEGRADMLSIMLLGRQVAYADMEFVLEAQVTSCFPTEDYYFIWTVRSTQTEDVVDVSKIAGSRLQVPAYSLKAGLTYDANCEVIKSSNGYQITQTGLQFQVLHRGLKIYLNVNHLQVSVNQPFYLDSTVINHDYYDIPISFKWDCIFEENPCDFFESSDTETLEFPVGLPKTGRYEIKVVATVKEQLASGNVTIVVVDNILPVIQISPTPHVVNEGSMVSLVANASNVAPTCTLTWYFADETFLAKNEAINGSCDDCQHGEAITDTLTIYSLEENFLNELTDFSNETEWRQVTAEIPVSVGRARFVAHCGCSLTFECETMGVVYADTWFAINECPKAGAVMVSPDKGTALETIFRISTLAVVDPDIPLTYSFYCRVGSDDVLLLGSFVEHLAVETFLPYIGGGIEIWVEVCDALGACSVSDITALELSPGEGSTLGTLMEEARAHVRRCEIAELQRDAVSAVVSYSNAGKEEFLSKFTSVLYELLPASEDCIKSHNDLYSTFIHSLEKAGVDISGNKTRNWSVLHQL